MALRKCQLKCYLVGYFDVNYGINPLHPARARLEESFQRVPLAESFAK